MNLEPRTLGVASNTVALCMTALAVLLWLSRKMYPGFGRWTLARILGVLTLFFCVQIDRWPHSILLADLFGTLSVILSLEACREFIGRPPVLRGNYVWGGVMLIQMIWLDFAGSSSQINYVEVTAAWACVAIWAGITLLRNIPSVSNKGRLITGGVLILNGGVYLVRVVYFSLHPSGTLYDSSPLNLGILLENMGSVVLSSFAFILMHYERVVEERAEEARRVHEANRTLTELKTNLEETVRQRTAELLQAQKLDSLGRLAGGVAHDFNNILTVINGQSSRVLKRLTTRDPLYRPVSQIATAGDRAAALTRRLLTFSSRQRNDPAIVSVDTVVRGTMDMLHRLIGEDIEIVFDPGPGSHTVLADAGQLEQVVMNLAINARDAMPDGGKLNIETSLATIENFDAVCLSAPPGRYVVLSVSDTGSGMTPEVQARLFEPFFTTKAPDKGTGLGLSTVYGIVKHSGGAVTVQSAPGLGSTFRIFLPPVEGVPADSQPFDPVMATAGGAETILVVEDQPDVRKLIFDILTESGYRALDAPDGASAVDIAERCSGAIHLLLSDMVLPGMNGDEMVDRIRSLQPGIRVLRMSGYAERAVRHGDPGAAFIQKPFTAEDLLDMIRRLLDGSADHKLSLVGK